MYGGLEAPQLICIPLGSNNTVSLTRQQPLMINNMRDPISREFTDAIAERQLILATGQFEQPLVVRLGAPVHDPSIPEPDHKWRCPIQIQGWDKKVWVPALGRDSAEALLAAIIMVRFYLRSIEQQSGGTLRWDGVPGHPFDFPRTE
jgi:hypothetical protein